MKKISLGIVLLLSIGMLLSAQTVGADKAQQRLKEISIEKFEDSGFWYVAMKSDEGYITHRRIAGAPSQKKAIEDEEKLGVKEADTYALGVRVDYLRRGLNSFSVQPVRPLPIEGIVKEISVWVIGRNYKHTLKLLLEDAFGKKIVLTMGTLNHQGWKQMSVVIPPSVVQRDDHYGNTSMGLKVLGFMVDCDLEDTFGSYYIYFDDLRAKTDLFIESARDEDDILDSW